MQVGAGVIIGGGITVQFPAAAGGPASDYMIVDSSSVSGSTGYGASDGYFVTAFGTIVSDYFGYIYYVNLSGNDSTNIRLKNGSYSGFTVTNGAIGTDVTSYPRVFSIGGSNYTFIYNSNTNEYLNFAADAAGLQSKVGNTLTILYNPASQISLTSNTIIVASRSINYQNYYGVDTFLNLYGTIVSDYCYSVYYDGSTTFIKMKDGTYTGFSVSGGLIDSDTTSPTSSRKFTIGGTQYTFTSLSFGPGAYYIAVGDVLSLVSSVGQTLSFVYDPNAQSGGGGGGGGGGGQTTLVTGTMTLGGGGPPPFGQPPLGLWGYTSSQGSMSDSPSGIVYTMAYNGYGNFTQIYFNFDGNLVDPVNNTLGGKSSITVAVTDSFNTTRTETATLGNYGGYVGIQITGDPFYWRFQGGQNNTFTISG